MCIQLDAHNGNIIAGAGAMSASRRQPKVVWRSKGWMWLQFAAGTFPFRRVNSPDQVHDNITYHILIHSLQASPSLGFTGLHHAKTIVTLDIEQLWRVTTTPWTQTLEVTQY